MIITCYTIVILSYKDLFYPIQDNNNLFFQNSYSLCSLYSNIDRLQITKKKKKHFRQRIPFKI